jgi:hypothetical protein
MKHLRIFENFYDVVYLDFGDFSTKLYPEELSFILFWTAYERNNMVEIDDYTRSIDPEYGRESGDFDLEILTNYENQKGGDYLATGGNVSYMGGFTEYRPSTWEDPAEGGDFELYEIEVNSLYVFFGEDIDLLSIEYKTDCFSKKDLINLVEEYSASKISGVDDRQKYNKIVFPEKLKQKMESLTDPRVRKGRSIIKRFGI